MLYLHMHYEEYKEIDCVGKYSSSYIRSCFGPGSSGVTLHRGTS